MPSYLMRNNLADGLNEVRTADADAGDLLDFYIWRAPAAGEEVEVETEGREFAVVVMSGLVDLVCGRERFDNLGGRASVFSGPATGAFVPPGIGLKLTSRSRCEVALCSVQSDAEGPPQIVQPSDVVVRTVGHWNWQRDVHNIIATNVPQAKRLVVGETFNLPGNWSSYPPHKHTRDDYPFEVAMEEVYHYRVNPPAGFGVQCLYDDDFSIDETYTVRDGDTVAIPAAYHPVAAAPGYQVYYLWMLAAYTDRRLKPHDDPKHAWVHAAGEMARGLGF